MMGRTMAKNMGKSSAKLRQLRLWENVQIISQSLPSDNMDRTQRSRRKRLEAFLEQDDTRYGAIFSEKDLFCLPLANSDCQCLTPKNPNRAASSISVSLVSVVSAQSYRQFPVSFVFRTRSEGRVSRTGSFWASHRSGAHRNKPAVCDERNPDHTESWARKRRKSRLEKRGCRFAENQMPKCLKYRGLVRRRLLWLHHHGAVQRRHIGG